MKLFVHTLRTLVLEFRSESRVRPWHVPHVNPHSATLTFLDLPSSNSLLACRFCDLDLLWVNLSAFNPRYDFYALSKLHFGFWASGRKERPFQDATFHLQTLHSLHQVGTKYSGNI